MGTAGTTQWRDRGRTACRRCSSSFDGNSKLVDKGQTVGGRSATTRLRAVRELAAMLLVHVKTVEGGVDVLGAIRKLHDEPAN